MIIGIINEINSHEHRVCATPQTVKKYINQGFKVLIETNAGQASGFENEQYISSGAQIKKSSKEILQQSDILLKIAPLTIDKFKYIKKSAFIIGKFQDSLTEDLLKQIRQKSLSCFALEKIPRVSKTQSFDILSSQDSLSGYQAIMKASSLLKETIPMMITSAGTLPPIKFLILGIGIAGLQAIATAKRLGGKVYAHDIRPETKEQAQSLGAIFIEDISSIISNVDVIITCAAPISKKAPILIKKTIIKLMKKGSILIDMSISAGGNIEGSQNLKLTDIHHCIVYANSNLADQIPKSASTLIANNFSNFIDYLSLNPNTKPSIDKTDKIIKATLI
jgi:NAD(P) transhydrogenase subunit alpha